MELTHLPIELIQYIAALLGDKHSLLCLAQTCRIVLRATLDDPVFRLAMQRRLIPLTPSSPPARWFKDAYCHDIEQAVSRFKIPPPVMISTAHFVLDHRVGLCPRDKEKAASFVWSSLEDQDRERIRDLFYRGRRC